MLRSAMTGAGLPMPGRQAILREYARLAPGYDRRWSSYIQAGVRGTLARLGARPAGAVLDVGCGTGALLAALAQAAPGGRLVITDWCDDYLACHICDHVLRLFNRAYYRAYRERECRVLLEALGIGPVRTDRYKISWLWGLMTAVVQKRVG